MKRFRLWFVAPLLALLALLSAATMVRAQSTDERLKNDGVNVKDDAAKNANADKPRVPLASDWSHRHMIYSNTAKIANSDSPRAKKLKADPRFQRELARRNAMASGAVRPNSADLGARALLPSDSRTTDEGGTMHRDWTSSLTTSGSVGDEQYPAKFSFNINATPSCTADFVVLNNAQSSGNHGTGFTTEAVDRGFFSGTPAAGAIITIDGVKFTATATATDINGVGEPLFYYGTNGTTAATNLAAAINAYAAVPANDFTYSASNLGGGFFGGGRHNPSSFITITDTTGGAAGNTTTAAPWGCFTFFGRTFGPNCPVPTPDANFAFFSNTFFGGRGGTVAAVANLIGLNELYTGSSPTGICSGTAPNVMFGYGVSTEGGVTSTSVALSEDGTQVAVVESSSTAEAANCPSGTTCTAGSYLHLVKWKAVTGGAITGTVTVPTVEAPGAYRACAAPCMTTIKFSTTTDSNSAPFIDYADDTIYVGDDNGSLYQIQGVFVGTPSTTPSWSSSVDSGYALTGPVYDSTSGNIYVADANGILSTVLASNGAVTWQTQTTGGIGTSETGTTGYPIPDPPIVDGSAETVTVFVSNDASTTGTPGADLDQFVICDAANQTLEGSTCTVGQGNWAGTAAPQIGPAGVQMHDGDFDNNYYSGNYDEGYLYFCGKTPGSPVTSGTDIPTIQRAWYDNNGFLINVDFVSTPNYFLAVGGSEGTECSPMTEVYNGSTDYMFFSVQGAGVGASCTTLGGTADGNPSGGCVMSLVLADATTAGTTTIPPPSVFPTAVTASIGEPGGTSGIIIDNVSTSAQASSVYFSPLSFATSPVNGNCASGIGCAVKATQAGLN